LITSSAEKEEVDEVGKEIGIDCVHGVTEALVDED